MPSIEEIKQQLQEISGGADFVKKSEIKELPNVFTEGERIEAIAKGRYSKQSGLIIATDRRVILIYKIMLSNAKVEDFPYEKINSVQFVKKSFLKLGEITIHGIGTTALIDNMDNDEAQRISEYIRNKVSKANEPVQANKTADNDDVISKLERLGKLKEQNLITAEEYDEQKVKLLERL